MLWAPSNVLIAKRRRLRSFWQATRLQLQRWRSQYTICQQILPKQQSSSRHVLRPFTYATAIPLHEVECLLSLL